MNSSIMTWSEKKSTKYIYLLAVCLCCLSAAHGQYSVEEIDKLILSYPEASTVLLDGKTSYQISVSKKGLDIDMTVSDDHLVTKTGGFNRNSEDLHSNGRYVELQEFNAYSLVPTKGKYKKNAVETVFNKDDSGGISFTTDSKVTQVYFPNTKAGVITHIDYKASLNSPYFIPSVYTKSFYPYERKEVEMIIDKEVDIEFLYMNMDEADANYTKLESAKEVTHRWVFQKVAEEEYFNDSPAANWYLPHILFKIKGYKTDNGYQKVLTDTKDLYSHYLKWIDQIDEENPEKMKPLVAEITEGAETDLEKLKNIFNWVQNNVKYISFTEGDRGVVPECADKVLTSRFGDCKGMTNLMYNMAELAGVTTHRTWIGSRDLPYSYDQFSSPSIDNHMILSYVQGDEVLFLDATSSTISFGFPSAFIQKKQALISINDAEYRLEYVPQVESDVNYFADSVNVRIEGNDLVGTGVTHLGGYHASRMKSRLMLMDEEEEEEYMSNVLRKGDDRFIMNDYDVRIPESDDPLRITYNFRIPNYVVANEDERYINLNFQTSFGANSIDDGRKVPVDMNFSFTEQSVVTLTMDEAMELAHIPDLEEYTHEQFGYRIAYSHNQNEIVMDFSGYSHELILYPEVFDQWNELSKKFRKSVSQNIIINTTK